MTLNYSKLFKSHPPMAFVTKAIHHICMCDVWLIKTINSFLTFYSSRITECQIIPLHSGIGCPYRAAPDLR